MRQKQVLESSIKNVICQPVVVHPAILIFEWLKQQNRYKFKVSHGLHRQFQASLVYIEKQNKYSSQMLNMQKLPISFPILRHDLV